MLLRCIRAALLVSHGLRTGVRVYLVLRGGSQAPRVVRIDGNSAKFIRPDERSLALVVQKTLAASPDALGSDFVELRPGVALARGDIDCVLADLNGAALYVLAEGAPDIRDAHVREDAAYFIGDHAGFAARDVERLQTLDATALSIGPISLHSDDVVAVLSNELARLACSRRSL